MAAAAGTLSEGSPPEASGLILVDQGGGSEADLPIRTVDPLMVAVAIATFVTPGRARAGLRLAPSTWAYTTWDDRKEADQAESARTADELGAHGWRSVDLTDAAYPTRLAALPYPPPVLFYRGGPWPFDAPRAIKGAPNPRRQIEATEGRDQTQSRP